MFKNLCLVDFLGMGAVPVALTLCSAHAAYPDRPNRMIVPSTPGGGTDLAGESGRCALTVSPAPNVLPRYRLFRPSPKPACRATKPFTWFGVLAPCGTPQAIVTQLHGNVVRAMNDPSIRKRFIDEGADPSPSASPEAFAALIRSEVRKWAKVIKDAGIQAE